MSTGSIGLSFTINNFPVKKYFDTRINVREDFNFMRYGSSFGLRNVGVSYLNSEPIDVNSNIIIKDNTGAIPENAPLNFVEDAFFSQTFDLPNAKFLITDVFKTTSLGDQVPLYYKHDLTDYSLISEIEILDGNFESVNKDLYEYIDEEVTLGYPSKSIYTNLRSEYNGEEETYTVYYVRFKDNTTGSFITELLNSKPFYQRTTFSSTANQRTYIVSPQFGLANIVVSFDSRNYSPTPLPSTHRFSVKVDDDDRIKVVLPPDLPASEKWYLRVNPGEFYKNTVDGDARYYVPEYEQQLFSPVAPFKLLVEQKARVITSKMIFVAPKPIANLETDGFYIYIILRDQFGNASRALTNDPSASIYRTPEGVITDVFFEKDMIHSVAEEAGFIRLNTDIPLDGDVSVTYRFVENYYSYRGISVNSTINPNVLNNRIVVYVKPEFTEFDPSGIPTAESVLPRTVFHLLIDEGDLILDSNETSAFSTIEGRSTGGGLLYLDDTSNLSGLEDHYTGYELEILSGPNAGRRLKITGYNTTQQRLTVGTAFEEGISPGIKYRINKRFEDYTFEDPVTSTLFSYTGWKTIYLNSPYHNILLADVYAIQTLAPQNISSTDIRIRGGGVKEDETSNALKTQDQAQWYWDIGYWDGQPYPGMGGLLVELPRSILKEVGGSFSRQQVKDIVSRHIGNGVYPVIRYYDRSTQIIDVEPKNQAIRIEWENTNGSSYNVYLSQNPDQLELYRSVAGVITELEIDGLDNDKVYYVMVEAVYGGVPQLPSRIAFAIPFDPSSVKAGAVYGETIYGAGSYSNG